ERIDPQRLGDFIDVKFVVGRRAINRVVQAEVELAFEIDAAANHAKQTGGGKLEQAGQGNEWRDDTVDEIGDVKAIAYFRWVGEPGVAVLRQAAGVETETEVRQRQEITLQFQVQDAGKDRICREVRQRSRWRP